MNPETLAYKPGLEGVVAAETRRSYVNGQTGTLLIAGYPLADIAAQATFEEVVYVLWRDRLPTAVELTNFKGKLAALRPLPAATLTLLETIAHTGTPVMDALRMAVGTLSLDLNDADSDTLAMALVARFPTIVAAYWRLSQGQDPITPTTDLGHAANYLYMLKGERPSPAQARGMATYLNTVSDHGLNASTFTARVIISTQSDLVSAITGAVGALKGPLHGGAPTGVYNMIVEIGTPDRVKEWFEVAMTRKERVSGIGHRVYKVMDPRATVLREHARELTLSTGNPIYYTISRHIELLALSHPYFQDRRLYTNVDYYTVTVLYSLGIPVEYMTPLFAVSRVAGWTAHIQEQLRTNRLIRPRAEYVGAVEAHWLPIEERVEGQIVLSDGTVFDAPNV